MKRVMLVFTAVLSLGFGTCVKAADASKAMPAIISYLLSGDSGGVVTQNDKFKRVSVNSTDGIVEDKQTGLFWQDIKNTEDEHQDYLHDYESGKVKYWGNAKTYCENSTFGNHNDWRLPNETELSTIVDTGHTPTINQIFNDMPDYVFFWTSVKVGSNEAIGIDFSDGKHYTYSIQAVSYTRCVRGEKKYERVSINSTDGIVKDKVTNLWWQDEEYTDAEDTANDGDRGTEHGKVLIWYNAINYCESLNYGSYSDWYLPSFDELKSIADTKYSKPAMNPVFKNTRSDYFWSSTPDTSDSELALVWDFEYGGLGIFVYRANSFYVRCVRAGQ